MPLSNAFSRRIVLFRFFGSSSVAVVSSIYSAAQLVGFTTKLTALFTQLMNIYSVVDSQFGLTGLFSGSIEKLYSILAIVISRSLSNSIDMSINLFF